ncbi:MAG: hypothetical protein KKG75_05245 [Nanoarchaeota archaeon]|nr:hypothetical protein [Nanoarchaeota archaeon]
MGTIEETKKRLEITKKIVHQLREIVKGVLLGGSMGFGQNFSVTMNSDIDMVIICDKKKIDTLSKTTYFKNQTPKNVLSMFKKGIINLFWVTKKVDSIEVNSFIYEPNGYEKFCLLKGGIKGYTPHKPSETQTQHGFDGKEITFKRNVVPYENGYLYEKPALVNGKFWGGPPRSDLLVSSYILYQEKNFFDDMKEKVWNSVLNQLIKEHGSNPDLNKFNILKTDFTYQTNPKKLPLAVIEKVKNETKYRLKKLSYNLTNCPSLLK